MMAKARPAQDPASTDRIEKSLVVRAPRSRVWRAVSNAKEFGAWFGMKLEGDFVENATVRGRITHKGYEHITIDLLVQRIEPERYFSYRWHPNAIDMSQDYSAEPTTLVEFFLEEAGEGTSITIIESGFDRIPATRRVEAFRMNAKGWDGQLKSIERHVS